MQSKATNVKAYIERAPQERRAALTRLRKVCHEMLRGYEECMAYGMPCYKKAGQVAVAFASQKRHVALYIMNLPALAGAKDLLKGLSVGKGCIRYPKPQQMDFAVVEKLLRLSHQSPAAPC